MHQGYLLIEIGGGDLTDQFATFLTVSPYPGLWVSEGREYDSAGFSIAYWPMRPVDDRQDKFTLSKY